MYASVQVVDPEGHASCHQPCHQASLLHHAADHRQIGITIVVVLTPLEGGNPITMENPAPDELRRIAAELQA